MKRGGASWARSLIGSVAIVAAASTAGAQQVELVPFRTADDGVVIEVGKPAPKPAPEPISMETSVSTDTLLQDFASLAPVPTMMPAVVPEQIQRSSIPVPLWMGAPQGLSYGQRQSEQMVNKSLSVAAKYIKFRGFVRLDELEVTGSPLVMFHPRSS